MNIRKQKATPTWKEAVEELYAAADESLAIAAGKDVTLIDFRRANRRQDRAISAMNRSLRGVARSEIDFDRWEAAIDHSWDANIACIERLDKSPPPKK